LRNLKYLSLVKLPGLGKNLRLDLQWCFGLRELEVSYSGFEDLQGLAACSQLSILTCKGCPIQVLPDLANFPKLVSLNVRDCWNLTKLTCTGPTSLEFHQLDVSGCMRLQALPNLTNSRKIGF